jgi:hypothetical protein
MGQTVKAVLDTMTDVVDSDIKVNTKKKSQEPPMGDSPLMKKTSGFGDNSICSWGSSSMQGWRVSNEDTHIA